MFCYTASSVQKELNANKELKIDGVLDCPRNPNFTPERGEVPCCRNYKQCEYAPKRECKQRLAVCRKNNPGAIMSMPLFRYTISDTNNDGCIEIGDPQLKLLIRKGYVNEKNLLPVA
jgi:hypothetical protein